MLSSVSLTRPFFSSSSPLSPIFVRKLLFRLRFALFREYALDALVL